MGEAGGGEPRPGAREADRAELGEPTWLQGAGAVAAWVHRPASCRARGAVVIAPPLGRDRISTYRALRYLAVALAAEGWVAVRFSWSGSGDSEGLAADCDVTAAWRRDLAAAVELAASVSGHEHVDAVGLRIGAAMLAAFDEVPLRTRILWEPVGGRLYLRQQQALLRLFTPEAPLVEGGVETPGEYFDVALAAAVRSLSDPAANARAGMPPNSIVHNEPDAETAQKLYSVAPDQSRVEYASVRRVISLLPAADVQRDLPRWEPVPETVVTDASSGARVRESFVRLGSHRLPGVLSVGVDAVPAAESAMLLLGANEAQGANHRWPALARHLAAQGIATLRADRRWSGDGEPGYATADPGSDTIDDQVADIVSSARWLRAERGRPVAAIGLCAGGWFAMRAASEGAFGRVLAANVIGWSSHPLFWQTWGGETDAWAQRVAEMEASIGTAPADPRVGTDQPAPHEKASRPQRLVATARRGVRGVYLRAPGSARRLVDQVRFRRADRRARRGVGESVLSMLSPMDPDTRLELVFSGGDRYVFERAYGREAVRLLVRRGRDIVAHPPHPDSEHSLFPQRAWMQFVEHVDASFAPAGGARARTAQPSDGVRIP